MTPYNTGKVQIGVTYTRPNTYESDPDMELVQRSLTRPPKRQVEAYRQHQRATINEAILWAASVGLFLALIKSPAIWSFLVPA